MRSKRSFQATGEQRNVSNAVTGTKCPLWRILMARGTFPCLTLSALLATSLATALALTGCAGFESTASNPVAAQSAVISGNVHGG
jgi:hypothetical protein